MAARAIAPWQGRLPARHARSAGDRRGGAAAGRLEWRGGRGGADSPRCATQLALSPENLALTLGPHVARLAAAVGSLRPRGESDGGEPQGYDGLTRRGPFERLLLSEWLYALESPDEFVRRAAFGEQAFLKPAFKQPQGSRRTVVLLDAGPDQLGAPRIAHLALLVVLQRRAEAAGAEFAWGVLQNLPDKGAFNAVTPATVQTWLDARSVVPARGEHVARWREALGDRPRARGWLARGRRAARALASRHPLALGRRLHEDACLGPGAQQLGEASSLGADALLNNDFPLCRQDAHLALPLVHVDADELHCEPPLVLSCGAAALPHG